MQHKKILTVLALFIAMLSVYASCVGIFSSGGPGPTTYTSVRGKEVILYGKGAYQHMSQEVAPQGIAQDVITLSVAVPLLLTSLFLYRRGSFKGKILFAGVLGYFMVTYTFFTLLAMYNRLFLVWIILMSFSFHAFYLAFSSIKEEELMPRIRAGFPSRLTGGFLIFNAVSIGMLWLSIILPHTIKGTIPDEVEHYTTLVVQAIDLAIGLPASFIAGTLLLKKKPFGYKLAAVYIVFLVLQMTALSAKVVAMGTLGYNIIPVVFIIPTFNIVSLVCAILSLRKVSETGVSTR